MMLPLQIKRLSFMLLVCVLAHSVVFARPGTQPPSVALRTELSHVLVVELAAVDQHSGDVIAVFTPLRALHNSEDAEQISLAIPAPAMPMLKPGQRYIIAYQKQRRVGKGEPRRYEPFPDGPVLLTEQGASPALFPYHEQLEQSLSVDPVAAADDPAALIAHIKSGLDLPALAHKRFYLRELINWTALHDDLTDADIAALRDVFTAPWLASDMLAAFFEPRSVLQQMLGEQLLTEQALTTLAGSSVQVDFLSAQPYLLLQMLAYLDTAASETVATADLARWLYSNHHVVAERALLLLAKVDTAYAVSQARQATLSASLPVAVQQTLQRFLRHHDAQ